MDGFSVNREFKFTAELERTTTGKYRWRAKASGDTIQELDLNLRETRLRVIKLMKEIEEEI